MKFNHNFFSCFFFVSFFFLFFSFFFVGGGRERVSCFCCVAVCMGGKTENGKGVENEKKQKQKERIIISQ